MNRFVIIAALLGMTSSWNRAEAALKPGDPLVSVQVDKPQDLELVSGVSKSLDTLGQKVRACIKAGGSPSVCQCQSPKDIAALKTSYSALVKKHPDWADKSLSYATTDAGGHLISGALALPSLKRQIDMLKCQ